MRFRKEINDLGKSVVVMDLGGLKLPVDYDVTELCKFQIDTYTVLKAKASEFAWNTVFGTTHKFLDGVSDQEKIDFATMIVVMHYRILQELGHDGELDGAVLTNLETELSQMLFTFDQKYHLFEQLVDFTEANIPIQSFSGVGERAQDSVEMTFYRDDVVRLIAVILSCKMMTPIFGIFLESCKKRMDNAYKEVHCSAILKDYFDANCKALTEKTIYFIGQIIKPMLNKTSLTNIFNGYTANMVVHQIFASMNTRRYIYVDLFKENGNVVVYLTSCCRAAAQTQFSSNGFKIAVTELFPAKEQSGSDDDGNISNLESESRSSSKTADFQILIKSAALQTLARFPVEMDLDTSLLVHMQDFHEFNHVALTPLNSYLLGIVFGDYLGGAASVPMLDAVTLNKLVPLLQLYLYHQGYMELVHACTIIPTEQIKGFQTGTDTQLRTTWNNSFEYRNCDEMFPYSVNDMRWDTGLKIIVEEVTSKVYLYNTAPVLWEKMQQELRNNEQYVTPEGLSREICGLISQLRPQ